MIISKFMSPEIIFGQGALSQVGDSVRRLGGTRVFLVSDPGVVHCGWVDKALPFLKQCDLKYEVWDQLSPNPKDHEVQAGAQIYRQSKCDAVMAIGGGSAIDAAKAVAILASNGGRMQDYEGVDNILKPLPPMVMVPSTAGSGAEVSQFSVIVDTTRKIKMNIVSKSLVPDICITDPLLLVTVDSMLTAYTGIDAITHAIEAYVSLAATSLTDVHSLSAIRLVARNLPASVASMTNIQAKEAMAVASLHAGLASSNAILGLAHAIAHQLGGLLDIPHGEANAIVLPHVMKFNLISSEKRYGHIAQGMGARIEGRSQREAALMAIQAMRDLAADVGISQQLSRLELTPDIIKTLSANAVKDVCVITNPRDVTQEDVTRILQQGMLGED